MAEEVVTAVIEVIRNILFLLLLGAFMDVYVWSLGDTVFPSENLSHSDTKNVYYICQYKTEWGMPVKKWNLQM